MALIRARGALVAPSYLLGRAAVARRSGAVSLIRPGELSSLLTLSRPQVNARATALGADEINWFEFDADAGRFFGPRAALLTEPQRTNAVRNPRAEGAAAGTPGTLPTNWTLTGLPAGLSSQVVAVERVGGVDCLRLRISGTASGAGTALLAMEAGSQIVASTGQTWAVTAFVARAVASGLTPTVALANEERGSDGVTVTDADASAPALSASAALERAARTRATVGASTARLVPTIRLGFVAGAYDTTFSIGWPQAEQATFQTTPILPPVGSPAASTRSRDDVTATLAALGLPASGAGTYLWRGALTPENVATTALFCVSDLTTSNQFAVFQAGSNITLRRSLAGVNGDATTPAPTRGTEFAIGLAVDGAGRAALSVNGAAVIAVTGGPTAGLTTLLLAALGNPGNAVNPLLAVPMQVLPVVLSDAELPARVANP